MNNKGQSVLSEHMMIFFAVIAALVTMTVFVQRGLQARIGDVENFTIKSVNNVCDANCQAATGGNVDSQYEPYYVQQLADVRHSSTDTAGATSGNAQAIGVIYTKSVNEATKAITASVQLPPACANGNCAN